MIRKFVNPLGGVERTRGTLRPAPRDVVNVAMADFDPYYRWLGIRDKQRPPNHYRLLGLDLFEDNAEVISEAADRQMGHVRTHQNGQYSDISQELLNELAKAKVCLLNRNRKEAYDGHLRKTAAKSTTTGSVGWTPPPQPVTESAEDTPKTGTLLRTPPSTGAPRPLTIKLTVQSGPQKGQIFEFSGRDTITVGRSRQATFPIKGDRAFSRVHFSIRVNPPVCFLKNLNDKQGTKVNGKPVVETVLRNGDIITGGLETSILVEIREGTVDEASKPQRKPLDVPRDDDDDDASDN